MRKRRTRKYTWLPVLGQDNTIGAEEWTLASFSTFLDIPPDNSVGTWIWPVLADHPDENYGVTDKIGDVLSNDYFLKRIVGKCHIAMGQDARAYSGGVPPTPYCALITAGFFISRVDTGASAVGEDYPIGLDTTATLKNFENYGPASRDTSREPWIWRRTWCLSNRLDDETTNIPGAALKDPTRFFPQSNAEYGSVLDGPHIDAKTARRVTNDERLFFAMSAGAIVSATSAPPANAGKVSFSLDIRCLGALRRSRNRGVF